MLATRWQGTGEGAVGGCLRRTNPTGAWARARVYLKSCSTTPFVDLSNRISVNAFRATHVIVCGAAVLVACAGTVRPSSPLTERRPAEEAAVYEAVLSSCCESIGDTLLVRDSTIGFLTPDGRAVPAWRQHWDSIPPDLGPTLDSVSRQRRSTKELPLPRPVVVLRADSLRAIFSRSPDEGWNEFVRRFPAQRRYFGFSPVAFSKDGINALVYMAYYCGALCASGDAYWLSRAGDGRWRLRQRIQAWAS